MFILRVPDGYNTGEAHAQMYDEEFVEAGNRVSPICPVNRPMFYYSTEYLSDVQRA